MPKVLRTPGHAPRHGAGAVRMKVRWLESHTGRSKAVAGSSTAIRRPRDPRAPAQRRALAELANGSLAPGLRLPAVAANCPHRFAGPVDFSPDSQARTEQKRMRLSRSEGHDSHPRVLAFLHDGGQSLPRLLHLQPQTLAEDQNDDADGRKTSARGAVGRPFNWALAPSVRVVDRLTSALRPLRPTVRGPLRPAIAP